MKRIIFIFCVLVQLFFLPSVSAAGEKVEDVFLDIESDYEYRDELQTLYDRGMILPNVSKIFGADTLLNRDEFVGISLEVSCEGCIQPHTKFETIEKYFNQQVYFDLDNRNPYFYCVAEADNLNAVRGYDVGESCQNGDSQFGERPFCPLNRINIEEAVAVLLRNSGIYTIEENRETISNIDTGIIYQNIANDVSPKNSDGSAYTFYGYLQKALSYEIVEYDTQGNEKIMKLLEADEQGNVYPKKQVSKEEFLRMSYIVLKSNSCVAVEQNEIASLIEVYNASCTQDQDDCPLSDLASSQNTYDFSAKVDGFCSDGIDDTTGYTWRLYNLTNGEEFFYYGKYIDNIELPSPGEWRVSLNSNDRCGNTGQVYSTIVVGGDIPLQDDQDSQGIGDSQNNQDTGTISIYPGDCSFNCESISPRDVGDGKVNDNTNNTGPDDSYDFVGNSNGNTNTNYTWSFTHMGSGETETYTGGRVEDYTFGDFGDWDIVLQWTGDDGREYERTNRVNIPPQDVGDSQNDQDIGTISIYPGDCSFNCESISPRDVGDGEVNDNRNNTGPDDSYDFVGNSNGNTNTNYTWSFTHMGSGETETYTGGRVEDYTFGDFGDWDIVLQWTGDEGREYESTTRVNISNPTGGDTNVRDTSSGRNSSSGSGTRTSRMSVSISTGTLSGYTDFVGKFGTVISGGTGPYNYSWNFGDGGVGNGRNVEYVYTTPGIYTVSLTVTDSDETSTTATVVIQVQDGDSCEQDADGDGIVDCKDLCPIVSGSISNTGCPILEESCDESCGCKTGYSCDTTDPGTCGDSGVCKPEKSVVENCLYSPKQGNIFGNTTCTTCPCSSSLDFLADIRRCDILFPAITSPDGSEIYSQGNFWEVE